MPRAREDSAENTAVDMAADLSDGWVDGFRAELLAWYTEHHRALPWRPKPGGGATTPYHVLLSEAMLQQTQVATVVPYFHRFIEAFPTLADLAAADEQQVLTLWQGLGYYRRARNLHAAAGMIVERHGGEAPATVEELLTLPGVGRYTAGAIASIAHGQRAPILDGNVARVLARLLRIEASIDATATRKTLWSVAERLVPEDHPGDFNQAMMELGATICTPKSPKCMYCPVRSRCEALAAGQVAALPQRSPKKQPKAVTHRVLAIHRGGKYLLEQRPGSGLWSNMWQLPTREDGELDARDRFGLTICEPTDLGSFTHQTTHRTIRFEVRTAEAAAGRLKPKTGVWRSLSKLDDLPLANPQHKVLAMLREQA